MQGMCCATLLAMKNLSLLTALILGAALLHAQAPSPSPSTGKTPATLAETSVFSSDWGFELTYPSDWVVTDLSPVQPVIKMESELRKNCWQRLFHAKKGTPASTYLVQGETEQCLGRPLSLVDFAADTMVSLRKLHRLSNTEYGAYSIKGVSFWVLRTNAAKPDHPEDTQVLEEVIAVLPKGMVIWSAYCKDEAAQKAFEHTHLRLANGGDTEMIPASAFGAATPAENKPQEKN